MVYFLMRPRIAITGSVHLTVGLSDGRSVRPSVVWSVRPLVGASVTLLSKTREINIFEQIYDQVQGYAALKIFKLFLTIPFLFS